ncbi:MAG: PIN domain nuclease, partial [Candidatus Omnitrophica bacterium CG10_big_fil_rev_8_21_14_0_10_43_8]
SKIVKLAKMLNASVFTNDYNLNKIAELQGVTVLNINDLTNALKVVVLPGELLQIRLIKEGKEHNQAIGYLEDGTMVVVDNAKHLIGQAFNVEVTSALQTSAGRMIFAKITHERKR